MNQVKIIRLAAGMTQAQLAKELGMSCGAVAMWEQGQRAIGERAAQKLCKIFGVNRSQIYGELPIDIEQAETVKIDEIKRVYIQNREYFDMHKERCLRDALLSACLKICGSGDMDATYLLFDKLIMESASMYRGMEERNETCLQ